MINSFYYDNSYLYCICSYAECKTIKMNCIHKENLWGYILLSPASHRKIKKQRRLNNTHQSAL